MFELFCLGTFCLFFLFWAIEAIVSFFLRPSADQTSITRKNNNESKIKTLKQSEQQIQARNDQERRSAGKQVNFTDCKAYKNSEVSTNPSGFSYSSRLQQQKDISNNNDNMLDMNYGRQNQQIYNNVGVSATNELDLGMIGDKDTQMVENEKIQQNEEQDVQNFLNNFEAEKQQEEAYDQQKENSSPIGKDQIEYHEKSGEQRKQERSQLQIIQALSTNKNFEKFDNIEDIQQQILEEPLSKNIQNLKKGTNSQKNEQQSKEIIQQIDQLFLNNQQQFFSVINKYKIQEARYNINSEDLEINKKRVEELQEILRSKDHQISILQIGVNEYKVVNQETARLNQSYVRRVNELEEEVEQLKYENGYLKKGKQSREENWRKDWEREKKQLIQKLVENQKVVEQLKKKEYIHMNILAQYEQKRNLTDMKQLNQQQKKGEANIDQKLEPKEDNQRVEVQTQTANNKIERQPAHLQAEIIREQEKPSQFQDMQVKQNEFEVVKKSYQKIKVIQLHNQNLKNQIEFAQTQIRMFEQSEEFNQKKIRELENIIQANQYKLHQLRTQIIHLQPILSQYESIKSKYQDIKAKYQKLLVDRHRVKVSDSKADSPILKYSQSRIFQTDQYSSNQNNTPKPNSNNRHIYDSNIHNEFNSGHNGVKFSPSSYSSASNNYRFLTDCSFVQHFDRQFIYETLKNLLKGALKTQKLYNSRSNLYKNPHELIDNIRGILLIIQLQNNKILGAYTHEAFSPTQPQSSPDNIAFIFDISKKKYFTNQTGVNSISYNPNCIIWGLNEIMLKYEEKQVMYTNFCRNHNIYWDGKYKIEQFIGSDKQWARITQYELYRVSKI